MEDRIQLKNNGDVIHGIQMYSVYTWTGCVKGSESRNVIVSRKKSCLNQGVDWKTNSEKITH